MLKQKDRVAVYNPYRLTGTVIGFRADDPKLVTVQVDGSSTLLTVNPKQCRPLKRKPSSGKELWINASDLADAGHYGVTRASLRASKPTNGDWIKYVRAKDDASNS